MEFIAAFAAGIATLATPCVLPLVPIYLATLMGGSLELAQAPQSRRILVGRTAAFSLGLGLVFTLLGVGAGAAGAWLAQWKGWLTGAAGVVAVLAGTRFLGLWDAGFLNRDVRSHGPRTVAGAGTAFMLGGAFALGWTPCAGPVLASVLGRAASGGDVQHSALLLAVYSAGLALPLLLVAVFVERLLPLLRKALRHVAVMQRVTGVLMVVVGVVMTLDAVRGGVSQGPTVAVTSQNERLDPVLGAALARPRLVEVVQDGCPTCRRMGPRVEALRARCGGELLDVHTVSLSHPENGALAAQLGTRAVPTFILVDDHGVERGRLVGERSEKELFGLATWLQGVACADVPAMDPASIKAGTACGAGAVDGACEDPGA